MKKVFIIEDDQDIFEAIRMILGSRGFIVQGADDAISLKAIEDFMPDLILTDLSVKNAKGGRLIDDIQANKKTKNTPLIIISGQSPETISGLAKELKISGFLQKPFNMEDLVRIVEENTG